MIDKDSKIYLQKYSLDSDQSTQSAQAKLGQYLLQNYPCRGGGGGGGGERYGGQIFCQFVRPSIRQFIQTSRIDSIY